MLRAVIFDFNGIAIDDEHIHFRVFQKVLREEGFDFTEQHYFGTYLGLDDRGCFAAVMTDRGRPTGIAEVHELVERKAAYYLRELERNMILFPGMVDFVGRMAQRSALAVCSGARQHEIKYMLDKSGMRRHFSVIISADQVH